MRFYRQALLFLVFFAVGSHTVVAADGPVLSQIRAKLPTPGTVLVDHEDASTLIPAMAEGSSNQVIPVEKANPFSNAVRVRVARAYETSYRIQIFSAKTLAPVRKGDTLFLTCWLRAPETGAGQSGLAFIYLQTTGPEFQSPAGVSPACERKWKQVFATGIADRDYPAGSLQVAIHLGQQRQVIDSAGLVVLDLGPGVDAARLPHTSITWRGMEADAPGEPTPSAALNATAWPTLPSRCLTPAATQSPTLPYTCNSSAAPSRFFRLNFVFTGMGHLPFFGRLVGAALVCFGRGGGSTHPHSSFHLSSSYLL